MIEDFSVNTISRETRMHIVFLRKNRFERLRCYESLILKIGVGVNLVKDTGYPSIQ